MSLKYLQPDVYYDLVEKIDSTQDAREKFVQSIVAEVKKHMDEAGIKAQVDGRVKHFFSIYKKMVNQDKTLDQIYDLFAVRIIVDTVKDCYAALGVIHEMYTSDSGAFQGLHCHAKAQYVSVTSYDSDWTKRYSRLRFRFVPLRCIELQNMVSQLTGSTRRQSDGKKSTGESGRSEDDLAASDSGVAEGYVR